MPETTPLIKAALNLRVGVGFDVYISFPPVSNTTIFYEIKYIKLTTDKLCNIF